MPLTQKVNYFKEPTPLQCGQAVLAMLCDTSPEKICELLNNACETTLKEMFYCLEYYAVNFDRNRKEAFDINDLPKICILSLETPRCWHWSLYFDGVIYDPEHGILSDFPQCKRKYFWQILE